MMDKPASKTYGGENYRRGATPKTEGVIMFKKTFAVMAVLCAMLVSVPQGASAGPNSCDNRSNNNIDKLLECVTVEGVRSHQAAFQAAADANGGTREASGGGYAASGAYIADQLEAAGYDVTIQPFDFPFFEELNDAELNSVI